MRIVFRDRTVARDDLDRLIHRVADSLGVRISIDRPGPIVEELVTISHLVETGAFGTGGRIPTDGTADPSGEPLPPVVVEVTVLVEPDVVEAISLRLFEEIAHRLSDQGGARAELDGLDGRHP